MTVSREAAATVVELAKRVRYDILAATTEAGSGHPSSSLSAADLMVGLMFGGTFRFDVRHPEDPNNDRLIFSKGHASPLFYALWAAAGGIGRRRTDDHEEVWQPSGRSSEHRSSPMSRPPPVLWGRVFPSASAWP